jgi:hypothetical protein
MRHGGVRVAGVLSHVTAIRYITPLREGGSLPGLMEADDLGTYVVKFRGAGQGVKTLVAEVISGELGRRLGLPVPELVTIDVSGGLAAGEPDQEVQDLLRASSGLNLGMDFLPGALDFDAGTFPVDPSLAARVLWFDALVGNVDRSWQNPNMLLWHRRLYLIDHGATLTFHHNWAGAATSVTRPYDAARHALIGRIGGKEGSAQIDAADAELGGLLTVELLNEVVGEVPDEWLADGPPGADSPDTVRAAYVELLSARLAARAEWLPALRETAPLESLAPPTRRPDWLTRDVR